jgi:hypothetical protein
MIHGKNVFSPLKHLKELVDGLICVIPGSPLMTRVRRNPSANDGENDDDIEDPRESMEDISEPF